MTIGEKIKARRKELKMTTEELGRLIGVQRSAITKYEKNRVDLKSKQIQDIANALDINPALLLSDDPLLRRHIIETFINSVYVYDDHLKIIVNNLEGNQRLPLPDLPPCSDNIMTGVPTVIHPNTRVTIFRISI